MRAGFRIKSRRMGIAVLVRTGSLVVIPDVAVIEADMLAAILRSAGLEWPELAKHLGHVPSRSGFFTKPAVQPVPVPRDEPADSSRRRRS